MQYSIDSLFEWKEILLHDLPDALELNLRIVMDDDVAHPDYATPRNFGLVCLHRGRQFCRRLPDDRKLTNDGILGHLVFKENALAADRVLLDFADGGENVLQVHPMVPLRRLHSGRASARLYPRNAGLMLSDGRTSTFRFRASSRSTLRPERPRRDMPSGRSTSRSTSLGRRGSPRSKEP